MVFLDLCGPYKEETKRCIQQIACHRPFYQRALAGPSGTFQFYLSVLATHRQYPDTLAELTRYSLHHIQGSPPIPEDTTLANQHHYAYGICYQIEAAFAINEAKATNTQTVCYQDSGSLMLFLAFDITACPMQDPWLNLPTPAPLTFLGIKKYTETLPESQRWEATMKEIGIIPQENEVGKTCREVAKHMGRHAGKKQAWLDRIMTAVHEHCPDLEVSKTPPKPRPLPRTPGQTTSSLIFLIKTLLDHPEGLTKEQITQKALETMEGAAELDATPYSPEQPGTSRLVNHLAWAKKYLRTGGYMTSSEGKTLLTKKGKTLKNKTIEATPSLIALTQQGKL
jgi:hypothetical protein